MKVLISTSAALTPAQEKKIVLGTEIVMSRVVDTRRVGGGPQPKSFAVKKEPYTVVEVQNSKSGSIKSVVLYPTQLLKASRSEVSELKLTATSLANLLSAPIPTKADKKGTKALRIEKAGSGKIKASPNASFGDAAKLAAISEELKALNERRKALEDQYMKLKKKIDPKAYRGYDDSSLKRRAMRKGA